MDEWIIEKRTNKSEYIENLIKEDYNNNSDPVANIHRLNKLIGNLQVELDYHMEKLDKIVSEGNKQEREQAEALMEKNKVILEQKKKLMVETLEKVKTHPKWIEFAEKQHKERDIKKIITFNEELVDLGINVGGWAKIKMLLDEEETS